MTDNNPIAENLKKVHGQIEAAAIACSRSPNDIQLLAVSKTKPVSDIMLAYDAGHRNFGENYVQEGVDKIQQLKQYSDILWHFIGPIQSNKSKLVAENFDWVHSVDRFKIAKRLNDQRPEASSPLQICIQVNIDNDPNKSGVPPKEVSELIRQIEKLPNLKIRGLMTIPKAEQSDTELKDSFSHMQDLFIQCQQNCSTIDTLSMGMTQDLALAISQGSTMVRVGTAIFGVRNKAQH
ncbi:YggS family pyridoxal phosphate-dependent enzyme [Glaciecola sp. 1036]|uniref:YggS family pyridoxal phosphate-dependent enzyme n=1 Tax=Alteromonadaceae TaxID=72275 RepID=UPI003CFD1BE8